MSDSQTIFALGLALALLVLLALPVWRATAGTPGWIKITGAALLVTLALSVVALHYISSDADREMDRSSPESAAPAPDSPGAPAGEMTPAPKKAEPPSATDETEGNRSEPPVNGDGAAKEDGGGTDDEQPAGGSSRGWTSPPAPSAPARAPSPIPAPTPGPSLPPPPAPPAGGPQDKATKAEWDVVPVFYGTDRARSDTPERADYNNDRGRRLELGEALVTVPRSHTIPQIERPWSIHIPYFDITVGESEDPNNHFTMKDVKPLTRDEFLDLVRTRLAASQRFKKHAIIFIHGYNTTFDYAIFRTAQIAYDLKFDGAPFCYSWPSGGGLASYTFDRERSAQAAKFLREYIELVLDQTGAEAVSVVAHSMGNQPMLQVLKDIKAARPKGLVFNQIILAAPDVDRDSFGDIANEIRGLAKNITLYASENDNALLVSRQVNGGSRAGDIPAAGPLIIPGVDTLDVTSVSTDSLGINHSGYAENNKLLADIELLISKGDPPSIRLPSLEVVPLGPGKYWRFPKQQRIPPP